MYTKEKVGTWLRRTFLLRLHMAFILGGTFCAGLLTTYALMHAGIYSLPLRYGIAVCAAYVAFLVLIRLWLAYVGIREGTLEIDGYGPDLTAHAAMDTAVAVAARGKRKVRGDVPDVPVLDFDASVVVILFLLLVAALLFSGVYLIYTAPAILTEAAFEAILTTALIRRAKKIDRPGWVGAVTRTTAWPFLGILALTALLGFAAQKSCPSAARLRDVFHCPGDLISSPPP